MRGTPLLDSTAVTSSKKIEKPKKEESGALKRHSKCAWNKIIHVERCMGAIDCETFQSEPFCAGRNFERSSCPRIFGRVCYSDFWNHGKTASSALIHSEGRHHENAKSDR
jgi:hypothetical protein